VNAPNKWNGARKVMTQPECGRVCSKHVPVENAQWNVVSRPLKDGDRVNALGAMSRGITKQTLKVVVEVQYTTDRLDAAG
jgi:hypothetical protein